MRKQASLGQVTIVLVVFGFLLGLALSLYAHFSFTGGLTLPVAISIAVTSVVAPFLIVLGMYLGDLQRKQFAARSEEEIRKQQLAGLKSSVRVLSGLASLVVVLLLVGPALILLQMAMKWPWLYVNAVFLVAFVTLEEGFYRAWLPMAANKLELRWQAKDRIARRGLSEAAQIRRVEKRKI